jgi:hypothetical protein
MERDVVKSCGEQIVSSEARTVRTYYNTNRRHSSLGYVPPLTYIERVRTGLAQGSSPGIKARYQERLRQWLAQLAVARKRGWAIEKFY